VHTIPSLHSRMMHDARIHTHHTAMTYACEGIKYLVTRAAPYNSLFIFYGRYVATVKMSLTEVFILLLSFICYTSALYFHIGETEKKCFIEDIPDETMVVGEVVRHVHRKQME